MIGKFVIERGDIFYITKAPVSTGSEQIAGRPGIIVSNNENNAHSTTVEVVYCTTKEKPFLPTHTTVLSTPYESTVLCEQVTTVSVNRLGDYIGKCNTSEMENIDRCLLVSMGLSSLSCSTEPANPDGDIEHLVERDLYKKMYEIAISKFAKISAQLGAIERNGTI